VSGLLLAEGLSSSKHSGVRALFDLHWIAQGRLPKSMGQFYYNGLPCARCAVVPATGRSPFVGHRRIERMPVSHSAGRFPPLLV